MSATITVQTREGTFVYAGSDLKGNARWVFGKPGKDGKLRPRPAPRRMQSILNAEKRKANQ